MGDVFHGGRLDAAIAEFGGKPEDWLDLSTGINPNPYPVPEISHDAWARLPDAMAEKKLLDAARAYYQVPEGFEIVAAPGTQAVIQLLARLIEAKDVSIVSPTYAEHQHAWSKSGSKVAHLASLESTSDVLVVVNPNNPTGKIWSKADLRNASGTTKHLVIDEAFVDPIADASIVHEMIDKMIVLKSFGKFFGLAGLRLGFAICNAEVASRLRSLIGPWAVSGPALQVGTTALRDNAWVSETKKRLQIDSNALSNILKNNGFSLECVNSLFVSVHHPKASQVYCFLAEHNILVRPFPDREGYLRFGLCGNSVEFDRLERVLQAFSNA